MLRNRRSFCLQSPKPISSGRGICSISHGENQSLDTSSELDTLQLITSLAQASTKKKRASDAHPPTPLMPMMVPRLPHPLDHDLSRPSLMDFNEMISLLKDWETTYGSCIVPHRCFDDAMGLGAWVRWVRKQRRSGLPIERWKMVQLDQIGFQWTVSRQDAMWHGSLHHYRQFKTLRWDGGLSEAPGAAPQRISDPHSTWSRELDAWLVQQGRDFVEGRLSVTKRRALEAVGVTLNVSWDTFERAVSIQGLNGFERKRLRQLWKATEREVRSEVNRERILQEEVAVIGDDDLREEEEEEEERKRKEKKERERRRRVREEAARVSRITKRHPLLLSNLNLNDKAMTSSDGPPLRILLQPPSCDGD